MSRNDDGAATARPTVSVAIAAWNAEANIAPLLRAVCMQCQERVAISEIIVNSDCSSDRTVAIAKEFADPRLVIIDQPVRRGFAASVGSICATFTGDALVLLNDDIRIVDDRFVETAVMPIFREGADFVGVNTQPLPPRSFVETAYVSVFNVCKRIREALPQRDNVLTCDGAAMSLSSRFAHSIDLTSDVKKVGNVDAFLYFSCITRNFRYVHEVDTLAYYRSPATLADYIARNSRNDSQRLMLEKQFGSVVAASYRIPSGLYWRSAAREAVTHPWAALFAFVAGFYIRVKAKHLAENSSPTWESLRSSKELD